LHERRLALTHAARLLAHNPAALFCIDLVKGELAVGRCRHHPRVSRPLSLPRGRQRQQISCRRASMTGCCCHCARWRPSCAGCVLPPTVACTLIPATTAVRPAQVPR